MPIQNESYFGIRASFRFKANVKTDIMSDKLLQGVDEESCQKGEENNYIILKKSFFKNKNIRS